MKHGFQWLAAETSDRLDFNKRDWDSITHSTWLTSRKNQWEIKGKSTIWQMLIILQPGWFSSPVKHWLALICSCKRYTNDFHRLSVWYTVLHGVYGMDLYLNEIEKWQILRFVSTDFFFHTVLLYNQFLKMKQDNYRARPMVFYFFLSSSQ